MRKKLKVEYVDIFSKLPKSHVRKSSFFIIFEKDTIQGLKKKKMNANKFNQNQTLKISSLPLS
jgi:hypothetical protein